MAEIPVLAAREPSFVITYGPSGLGKSADSIWAGAGAGVFIVAHPDGVKPAVNVVGAPLAASQIRTAFSLSGAYAHLQAVVAENTAAAETGGLVWRIIVIDDLSMLVENELSTMKASGQYNARGGFSFELWTSLMAQLVDFGNLARFAGVHVLANAHERDPAIDAKGVYHRGGPALPSMKMIKRLPHIASEVWKAEIDRDNALWPAVIRCEPDPSWVMKSRDGLRGTAPLNVGEWLRSNGYEIPRPVGLEWIEDWAGVIAQRLGEGADRRELTIKARDQLATLGHTPQHIYWAIRDGVHRHAFTEIKANSLLGYL